MKRILLFLLLISVFLSCNPNEDIYDEINKKIPSEGEELPKGSLVMTLSDYQLLNKGKYNDEESAYFEDRAEAIDSIVSFLGKRFSASTNEEGYLLEIFFNEMTVVTPTTNEIVLAKEDYDSFGFRYPNFSSSASPEDYLPHWLKLKMPYAKTGDEYQVKYDYYQGGGVTEQLMSQYKYDGVSWTLQSNSVMQVSDRFIFLNDQWQQKAITPYVITQEDYDATGDGKYSNYSYYDNEKGEFPEGVSVTNVIDAKIAARLLIQFPNAQENDWVQTNFSLYQGGGVTTQEVRVYSYDGNGTWEKIEL